MKGDRRNLIKALAFGSGVVVTKVPTTWSKPVVDSVIIPAHAQTTGAVLSGSRPIQLELQVNTQGQELFQSYASNMGVKERLVESLVPAALAADGPVFVDGHLDGYAESLGDGRFFLQVLLTLPMVQFIDNTDESVIDEYITQAFAGVEADSESCDAAALWRGEVQVSEVGGGVNEWKSPWVENKSPSESCGSPEIIVGGGIEPLRIDFRIDDLDDPHSPSKGNIEVKTDVEQWTVGLTLGGEQLKADCLAPCAFGSDRAIKENFASVDEDGILKKVAEMPIEYWSYTDRQRGVRHIGPMAQDFHAAFNVGDSDKHIHMVDANGVNLASIKALYRNIEDKDARIAKLEGELAQIKQALGLAS